MNAGTKVLVVDDDDLVRDLVSEILQAKGYVVLVAENGDAGEKVYDYESPSLVITDLVMPEVEGGELISTLRQKNPDLPIIAISGGHFGFGEQYLSMAKKLGANITIKKPFNNKQLIGAIEGLLTPNIH